MNDLRLNPRKWFPVAALNSIKNFDKTRKLLFYFKIALWMNYVTGSEQTIPISWSPVPSRKNWYPPASGIFFKFDIQNRDVVRWKRKSKRKRIWVTHLIYRSRDLKVVVCLVIPNRCTNASGQTCIPPPEARNAGLSLEQKTSLQELTRIIVWTFQQQIGWWKRKKSFFLGWSK